MRKFFLLGLLLLFASEIANPQSKADSLTDELKIKMFNNLKHFTFGFYVDAYVTMELGKHKDTSNIMPYFANCPYRNQFRLNVAALEIQYNADKVRGKLQLQFGDAPNLLAAPEKQWIKTMRQAYFGFRVTKNLWIDLGYQFTPVGCESAWPVTNMLSTASLCGYFEPGAMLGAKLSYTISEKWSTGLLVGNPYSLAYQQSNHVAGVFFLNFKALDNLFVSYNNMFGNQALRNAEIDNNLLYNDILITYDPLPALNLIGQFDFAFQTNSHMPPDSNKIASMCSGFIQARYNFLNHFSLSGRYEYYFDPNGFLSGLYTYNGKTTGLEMNGMGLSLEYRPVKISYIRCEYKFMHANKGNLVYDGKTSDLLNAIIFTAGVRF
jgi:hypothetical protein